MRDTWGLRGIFEADAGGTRVAVESFHPPHFFDERQGFDEVGACEGNDTAALAKRIHGEAGEECRGAAGGQYMAGAGDKIARAFRGPGSDKNSAGVFNFLQPAARFFRHDFKVFGGKAVDNFHAGVEIVGHDKQRA